MQHSFWGAFRIGGQVRGEDAKKGIFHDLFAFERQHAVLADEPRWHLCVGVNLFVVEAAQLDVACGDDATADHFRGFGRPAVGQILVGDGRNIHLNRMRSIRGPEIFDCTAESAAECRSILGLGNRLRSHRDRGCLRLPK